MGKKREEVEKAGRDTLIVRRALDFHLAGLMDYETAMEEAVLAQAEVLRDLEKRYTELLLQQPVRILIADPGEARCREIEGRS